MAMRKRELTVMYPNAAGIDIGSANHYAAVSPDQSGEPVKEFGCFTEDIEAMADWLVECGVDVVAMESTGVYWIAPYEILESRGLKVYLVNARHVRHVSGRKSDVLDCQWLQQLMSFGLLSGAFRPAGNICALRALSRQRDTLLREQARQVQRMQKALTQMNVQLTNVITDIVGKTGQEHHSCYRCGGARPAQVGEAAQLPDSRERRDDCEEPRRQLAGRACVLLVTGAIVVRHLPSTDCCGGCQTGGNDQADAPPSGNSGREQKQG